jgi:hypothetical protein
VIVTTELFARLLDDARRYDPAAHARGLLAPYREVLLLQRAKYMSYEQIAATLTRHGLKVSPAGVGVYCRRTFTKADIDAMRRHLSAEASATRTPSAAASQPSLFASASAGAPAPPATGSSPAKRGPKIARDNY